MFHAPAPLQEVETCVFHALGGLQELGSRVFHVLADLQELGSCVFHVLASLQEVKTYMFHHSQVLGLPDLLDPRFLSSRIAGSNCADLPHKCRTPDHAAPTFRNLAECRIMVRRHSVHVQNAGS